MRALNELRKHYHTHGETLRRIPRAHQHKFYRIGYLALFPELREVAYKKAKAECLGRYDFIWPKTQRGWKTRIRLVWNAYNSL